MITVQDLIDELSALPAGARTANVAFIGRLSSAFLNAIDVFGCEAEFKNVTVRYEHGTATITCEDPR